MINKERGAITLFTVVICMFLITNVILINIGIMNKNASQEKEIAKISDNYEVSQTKMEQAYQEVIESKEYPTYGELLKLLEQEKLKMYPVGSIYISTNSTDPSEFLGGTWERYGKGQTLVGLDENQTEFDTANETGGQKNITLSEAQLPSHSHSIPALSGSTSAAGKHSHTYSQSATSTGGTALTLQQIPSHTHTYNQANSTTGSHTITVAEMPSHSHTYNQANSTTGSHTLTTTEIPSHSHTYNQANSTTGSHTLTATEIPSHSHTYNQVNSATGNHTLTLEETPKGLVRSYYNNSATQFSLGIWSNHGAGWAGTLNDNAGYGIYGRGHNHPISTTSTSTGGTGGGGGHTHSISTTSVNTGATGALNGTTQAHTHSIALSSANTSEVADHTHTVTTNTSTTGTTGSGQAVNVQDPYITVYMWRRIS